MTQTTDIKIESNGRCFICLSLVSPHISSKSVCHLQIYSLQSLSRYLKLEVNKVFNGNGHTSTTQVTKVFNTRLKAELCEKCAGLVDKFSRSYLQLEKIQMEVKAKLKLIHDMLHASSEETNNLNELLINSTNCMATLGGDNMHKLNMFKVLREETIQKCSHKLNASPPQVHVANLTTNEISRKILKLMRSPSVPKRRRQLKSNSAMFCLDSSPVIMNQIGEVKVESPSVDCDVPDTSFDVEWDWDDGETEAEDKPDSSCSEYNPSPASFDDDGDGAEVPSTDFVTKAEVDNLRKPAPESNEDVTTKKGGRNKNRKTRPQPKCDICHETFRLKSLLNKHRRNKHRNEKLSRPPRPRPTFNAATGGFRCPLCPSEVKKEKYYIFHYRSIHLNIKYDCEICLKSFSMRDKLRDHQQSVHEGIRIECQVCKKSFARKSTLNLHLRKTSCGEGKGMKPPPAKHRVCQVCGKDFVDVTHLQRHVDEVHLKLRVHLCDLCGKSFSNKDYIRRHKMIVHPDEQKRKPFCDLCGKTFSNKDYINQHKRIVHKVKVNPPSTSETTSSIVGESSTASIESTALHKFDHSNFEMKIESSDS